jgi:hypothetical protein
MNSSIDRDQINPTLRDQLEVVMRRERFRRVCSFLAIAWIIVAMAGAVVLLVNQSATSELDAFVPHAWIWLLIGAVLATVLALVGAVMTSKSIHQIARQLEADFPELDSALVTALEQNPGEKKQLGFLQQDVIRQAVYHGYRNDWNRIIPAWQLAVASVAAAVSLAGLLTGSLSLWMIGSPGSNASVHLFDDVQIRSGLDYQLTVQPGNTEIERGQSLLVLAQFASDVPSTAEMVYQTADGNERKVPMNKALDDPVFAGRIADVTEALTYRVIYDESSSAEYTVSVFEFPRLVRCDADLQYPTYTQMPAKTLQDIRRISAVVGSEVTLKFFVNKPIASAKLQPDDDAAVEIELTQAATDPLLWTTTFNVEQSQKFRLDLIDNQGRANKFPPTIAVTAVLNQPPKIRLTEPARDAQVSAIEEINLAATAYDDFGLQRIGISYSIGGNTDTELILSDAKTGKTQHPVEYLLELEALNAQPDQLVSYHFWAEDIGPGGDPRRTASDLYFAEIRPFEEIYRQGQPGSQDPQNQNQPGNQNADRAMQLAELQKEIINATWRVIRRETLSKPTAEFETDVNLLIESQQSAISQVDELAQQLQDNQSQALASELKSLMNEAVSALSAAKSSGSANPLNRALSNEQSAYQMLLRMRDREFQVTRQNAQTSQSQNSQSNQQRQMQQMDLQAQTDRYEQERLAQEQESQSAEQRENRQILSRLRELARRQNDLNKRIKELQSSLQEAETETEQEAIEKQLKRLQEEQQQILRETDELQDRMQQPENQERMAGESKQLEQARENVQRASEALKDGQPSRAAAEGTRAERELKDLRDEFQKRTSGQFTQQMREMRNQARDLENQQQKLIEQLTELDQDSRQQTSLQSKDERAELAEAMEAGKNTTESLREQIKQTIEEAEEFEPLLADQLYDTYRDSEKSRPDRMLESARRALERGFTEDAVSQQRQAVSGIEDLRKGIDKAAESILGDETEALKTARKSLQELARQLDQEIERAQPQSKPDRQQPGENNTRPEPGELASNSPPSEGQSSTDSNRTNPGRPNDQPPSDSSQNESQQSDDPSQPPGDRQANQRREQDDSQGNPNGRQPAGQRTGNQLAEPENQPGPERQQARRLGGIAGNPNRNWSPITGEDFRDWSDRLRDVEEMLADPDLRSEAARIRDRAKAMRKEFKRHSEDPNWDLVEMELAEPLAELENRVSRELMRRDGKNSLVPLNRDPVPPKYENAVQKYYEQLGSGK